MEPEMEEFLDIAEGMGKTDSTLQNYRRGLDIFNEWLQEKGLEYDEVSPRDIKQFLAHLKNDFSFAPKTVRLRFTPVSQFYADLSNENINFKDPTDPVRVADYVDNIPQREIETKEKKVWLTKEEVQSLVENVPSPTIRNRLAVLLQYFTGLRRQEVVSIKLDDLDREEREVNVRGKGGKTHTAMWQPKLDGLLSAWLDGGYRGKYTTASESPYLFITKSTDQMNAETLNRIVVKAAEEAGIQEELYTDAAGKSQHKVTSHVLRHSFAMHWLQNGGSMEVLSKRMAHSSITTTQIYGEILEEREKEEYRKYAPNIDISF